MRPLLALFLAVVLTGCAFHGRTVVLDTHNYWQQNTQTIHVAPNQPVRVYWHEWCHGWQGETLPTTDTALSGWFGTPAGAEFRGTLEQAADVCAYTEMGVAFDGDTSQFDYIEHVDPSWAAWAARWVPKE